MHRAGSAACNEKVRSGKTIDVDAGAKSAREETANPGQRGEKGNGRNADEIEPAVVDASAWGEVGAVAELVGVDDGDEKGGLRRSAAIADAERVGIASVRKKEAGGGEEIGEETAARETFEAGEHGGVETDAHGAEK